MNTTDDELDLRREAVRAVQEFGRREWLYKECAGLPMRELHQSLTTFRQKLSVSKEFSRDPHKFADLQNVIDRIHRYTWERGS